MSERRIGPPLSFHPVRELQVVHFPILDIQQQQGLGVFSSASIRGLPPLAVPIDYNRRALAARFLEAEAFPYTKSPP